MSVPLAENPCHDKENPVKILLVSGHARNWDAGASTVYLHLEEELSAQGHDCRLLHAEDYLPPRLPDLAHKTAASAWVRRAVLPLARGVDVVEVAGNLGWPLFQALRELPLGTRPLLVNRLHGLEFKDEQARVDEEIAGQLVLSRKYKWVNRHWTNRQEQRTLALADLMLCHSSREADAAILAGWAAEERVRTLPLGVDARFFGDARARRSGPVRLLWWGTWVERKGTSALPRAFALACREEPGLSLTLGGTGRTPEQLLPLFAPEVRARVQVLPFVTREQHLEALRSHDLFVFPSLSEGFGLALLEAMAAELACITTFTGLAHDWLEPGQNVLLVPMSAPTALARAIVRLARDTDLRLRLGREARATAAQLPWARCGAETLRAYADGLQTLRRAPQRAGEMAHV